MATPAPRARRRRRRLVKVSVAELGLALGAVGTALAVQALQPTKDQVLVFCNVPGADFWQHRTGSQAPPLKAYQDTYSQIQVFPASQTPPADWRPLPGGVVQDPEQILLNEALGDELAGLQAAICLSKTAAEAKTHNIVETAGFSGWPLADGRAVENAGGEPICWSAFASPLVHKVLITDLPTPADFGRVPQAEQLVQPLRAGLSQCWTMSTAVDRVRAAIKQSGFPA